MSHPRREGYGCVSVSSGVPRAPLEALSTVCTPTHPGDKRVKNGTENSRQTERSDVGRRHMHVYQKVIKTICTGRTYDKKRYSLYSTRSVGYATTRCIKLRMGKTPSGSSGRHSSGGPCFLNRACSTSHSRCLTHEKAIPHASGDPIPLSQRDFLRLELEFLCMLLLAGLLQLIVVLPAFLFPRDPEHTKKNVSVTKRRTLTPSSGYRAR